MELLKKNYFNILKVIKNFNFKFFLKLNLAILKKNYSKYPIYVKEFEEDLSKKFNSKYSLSFSSGTSAFYASILSLNLKKKSKVLISSLTFPTIIEILKKQDFDIYYFDVDKNLNVNSNFAINQKYDLLVITHAFGFYLDFDPLKAFIDDNTKIIFDSSHSQGIKIEGINHVKLADISFMSLQGNKAISGGEGGVIFSDNRDLFLKMINNHHPGHIQNAQLKIAGGVKDLKLRMHPLAALIANNDLKSFDKRNELLKKKIEQIYQYLSDLKIQHPLNKNSKIGGFHFGIPFFFKSKINSKFVKKYNWYDNLDSLNIKSISQIHDKSFFQELSFLDLEWIKENNISNIKKQLKKFF